MLHYTPARTAWRSSRQTRPDLKTLSCIGNGQTGSFYGSWTWRYHAEKAASHRSCRRISLDFGPLPTPLRYLNLGNHLILIGRTSCAQLQSCNSQVASAYHIIIHDIIVEDGGVPVPLGLHLIRNKGPENWNKVAGPVQARISLSIERWKAQSGLSTGP